MNAPTTRDEVLKSQLKSLRTKILLPQSQRKIRTEILTSQETENIKARLYKNVTVDDHEFGRAFDFNGPDNMVALADLRGVSHGRILLDMSVEVGFLTEADHRRYLRQMESDTKPRESVPLAYSNGNLYVNGNKVGTIQERRSPTRMQTVLQMFEDQNWPASIDAPSGWGEYKITNTCSELRKRFDGHVKFSESLGGRSISFEIQGSKMK